MKTGIVILNYNDYDTTKSMIKQIKNYKCLDYILVVDNFSTNDSYAKLKKIKDKKIEVVKTDENKGYAYGNNFGIKQLEDKCDYIIISNPDILVDEATIDKLIKDLDENKRISVIAPQISELGKISRGWKCPTIGDDILSNVNYFHKFAKKKTFYNDEYYKEELTKVQVVHGCFFMFRVKDLKQVNYFDENTFLYYEENILAKKLISKNLSTYVDISVSATHNLSVSVDKSINKLKKYKILKTSQKYYEKKYNHTGFIGIFVLRLFYYISYGIAYICCLFKK